MDYIKLKDQCVQWIRDWFERNGKGCRAVLGMSGGKDSTVAAALCVEALGKENVVGVAMPAEGQSLNGADEICEYLGIRYICAPIASIIKGFDDVRAVVEEGFSNQTEQNIPPRVRMCVLYAISQSVNGRVVNTCNLSEDWVGYSTRYGDAAGDFSPCSHLTVQEMKQIGTVVLVRNLAAMMLALVCYFLLPLPIDVRRALAIIVFAPPSALTPAFTERCGGDPSMASCVSSLCILTALFFMSILLVIMNVA